MNINTRPEILHRLIVLGLFVFAPTFASAAVPAFPGAQGGGAASVGGRGGAVIEVTNLNDSGAGSLRACVLASGPRTCVFRVGGTINLLSTLGIQNPFITIAGQTAPGGGILLQGVNIGADRHMVINNAANSIIRYIRIRKGFHSACSDGATSDCGALLVIGLGSGTNVIDHVSGTWNQDEGMAVSNCCQNITFSYNLIAEGLKSHSTGYWFGSGSPSTGATMTNIDMHHNLTMNNNHRNPLLRNKSTRLVNNLYYNHRFYTNVMTGGILVDIIGNKHKQGPMSNLSRHEIEVSNSGAGKSLAAPGEPSVFLSGNVGYNQANPAGDQWLMAREVVGENGSETGPVPLAWRRSSPMANTTYPIIAEPVANIEESLLPIVGASRRLDCNGNWVANRDAVDTRLINQYQTNTGISTLPLTEADVGGFPTIANGTPCADADSDGMPDVWETANGLDPNNEADRNTTAANGYSNLENYLNGETAPPPSVSDAPTNLAATTVSSSQINLTWTDNANDESGFEVDRALNSSFTGTGFVANAYTTGANPTMPVPATGLAASTTYFFRARATNAGGASAPSNTASATTSPSGDKFVIGDRVQATAAVNVRATPEGTLLGTQPTGALGTVVSGPSTTPNGVIWWEINYDSGTNGWSEQDNLEKVSANVPPTVSITSPADGATFTAPASITINATAADSDGTVSKVDFYQGVTLLGTDTTSPYSFAWNNVAGGSYSLTAVATDNGSATTTSSAVNITVNSAPAAPAAPASLTATVAAAPNNINQINLSWTNVASETGYKIERKKGAGGAYSQIATTAADVVTYNDTTGGAGTQYYYRVRAYNGIGDSGYSPEANATTAEVTSGRRAHWKFDEGTGTTAADASGNGNSGTLANGPTWVAGKIGNAVNFDAINDVVNAGSGATLDNLPAITISAWIKANSIGEGGTAGRIVHKGIGTAATNGWHFVTIGANKISFAVDYATTNFERTSAANAISLGVWRHVIVTWTGSATATNARLYVDGVEASYGTTSNGVGTRASDAASSAFIGNNNSGARTFDGALDDVRIYNRVLTASEIQAVYRAGL